MNSPWLSFRDISFCYERASDPLFESLNLHFPAGWTGVIGANGAGKTTLLRLAAGELQPTEGRVRAPVRACYCPQRTDYCPETLGEFLAADSPDARVLRQRLQLGEDWCLRWSTLSHGERKRAQLGVALWRRPDMLAIDEPTNHLDEAAQGLLMRALGAYTGVGLLVSHNRELLDTLCQQCLFLDPPQGILRPGAYTRGRAQAQREEEEGQKERAELKKTHKRLRNEVRRRREKASGADRRRSKRGLALKDHDGREKLDMARVTGRDGRAGRLLKQMGGRLRQAEARLEDSFVKKEQTLGIWLPGSRSQRDFLFRLPAGELALCSSRRLSFPGLAMRPADRVALTGVNGSGKSTLVGHIVRSLDLPRERLTYLPQEVTAEEGAALLAQLRRMPRKRLAQVLTIVSRLNSRPERLLQSETPSPGELRKISLALGIAKETQFIILDEPTNHLDLPSIECLQEALQDCPCGLLLVSHDRRFLDALATAEWRIQQNGHSCRVGVV